MFNPLRGCWRDLSAYKPRVSPGASGIEALQASGLKGYLIGIGIFIDPIGTDN
jgi:hypothetical protein